MTRHSLWPLWTGFVLSLVAFLSYPLFFVRFPETRDFPWANLLLFAGAAVLAFVGLMRSFQPNRKRFSKIIGSVFAILTLLVIALFLETVFVAAKLPASTGTPKVGEKAPVFMLPDSSNKPVSLSDLLVRAENGAPPKGVLLVFYRGYW